MDSLFAFLLSKTDSNSTDPKRIDECIYTSYTPPQPPTAFAPPPKPFLLNKFRDPGSPTKHKQQQRFFTAQQQIPLQQPPPTSSNRDPTGVTVMPRLQEHQDENCASLSAAPNDTSMESQPGQNAPTETVQLDPTGSYQPSPPTSTTSGGEIFFFDYGVTVFWGLTEAQVFLVLNNY
jgi:uncharacterized Rmd1/YagE family protein